jgi:hypothetical protein
MRKWQPHIISRETPETHSLEHLPSRKVCHLPAPPQTQMLWRKECQHAKILVRIRICCTQYFFCHNYTEWETHSAFGVKCKVTRPPFLPCTANHTSFIFLSAKKEICHYIKCSLQYHPSRMSSKLVSVTITPHQFNIDYVADVVDGVSLPVEVNPSDGLMSMTLQSFIKQLKQKDVTR